MSIHALFVGVNDYPGSGLDLSGCVNDVSDWERLVKSDTSGRLLNEDATRANILAAIAATLSLLKSARDWAIIQFSGHGSWIIDQNGDEPDGRDEVLCPYDYRNPILDDEVHQLLSGRKFGRVLFVSDACHSGTVFRFAALGLGDNQPRARFMDPARFVDQAHEPQAKMIARTSRNPNKQQLAMPGVIHFAGCQDTEYCYDARFDGRPNGAFTYAALKASRDLKPGSTFGAWYRLIRQYLPSGEYPQKPKMNAAKEDAKLPIPWMN